MNTSKTKLTLLGVAGLLAVFVFTYIITTYIIRSRAAGEIVTITTSVPSTQVQVGQTASFGLILTAPQSKGISAASFGLTATNLKLTGSSNATPMDLNNPSVFTEIQQILSAGGDTLFKSVATIQSDDNLPRIVGFNVSFTCTAEGTGRVAFDKSKMEITGNITGDTYEINGTDSVLQFTCTGSSGITPPPTGTTVDAHFVPQTLSANINDTFATNFVVNGQPVGKGISAIDVRMKYDPSLVSITKIGDLYESGVMSSKFVTTILPPNAPVACKTDADCHICIDLAGTNCVTGFCASTNFCDFTNSGPVPTQPPVITIPEPSIDPTSVVRPTDVLPTQPPSSGLCTKINATFDNSAGTLRATYVCILTADKLPKSPALPITFIAKAAGSGTIHIEDTTKIAGNIDGGSYTIKATDAQFTITDPDNITPTVVPTATPTVRPTITPTVAPTAPYGSTPTPSTTPAPTSAGNVRINLKVKFQGITAKPIDLYNSLMVRCSLGDGGLTAPVASTVETKADANAVWSGTFAYNVPPGSGYKVLCKGPKHIQKRICGNLPGETFPGTYSCDKGSITLQNGDNNLDFSTITLLAGDLPYSDGSPADGIVMSYDTSLVRNLIEKTDPLSLKLADLNLDGAVNSVDHSIVIAALSVRQDEQ